MPRVANIGELNWGFGEYCVGSVVGLDPEERTIKNVMGSNSVLFFDDSVRVCLWLQLDQPLNIVNDEGIVCVDNKCVGFINPSNDTPCDDDSTIVDVSDSRLKLDSATRAAVVLLFQDLNPIELGCSIYVTRPDLVTIELIFRRPYVILNPTEYIERVAIKLEEWIKTSV